jgi:DNA-binding Lrp family transcriptional regulator
MSDPDDWRANLDATDAALLDGYQRGFPVSERPFEELGRELGVEASELVARVRTLREAGLVRRFGPVLNPPVLGASTLAALSVPEEEFDAVATVVNDYPQVTHNYRRDHDWNMWFVVTASSRSKRDEILTDIETRTGLDVLDLPRRTDYATRLDFSVVADDPLPGEGGEHTDDDAADEPYRVERRVLAAGSTVDLSETEARLLLAIQDGLPLSETPYRDVARNLGVDTQTVLDAVDRLLDAGAIKRVGLVVSHRATGFHANCMVAWDVPDDELDAVGRRVGALPFVTKCYHRPRRPDQGWPYTLFTMVHGRESDAVDARIDELADEYIPYPHARLPTVGRLKQTGARYEDLITDAERR